MQRTSHRRIATAALGSHLKVHHSPFPSPPRHHIPSKPTSESKTHDAAPWRPLLHLGPVDTVTSSPELDAIPETTRQIKRREFYRKWRAKFTEDNPKNGKSSGRRWDGPTLQDAVTSLDVEGATVVLPKSTKLKKQNSSATGTSSSHAERVEGFSSWEELALALAKESEELKETNAPVLVRENEPDVETAVHSPGIDLGRINITEDTSSFPRDGNKLPAEDALSELETNFAVSDELSDAGARVSSVRVEQLWTTETPVQNDEEKSRNTKQDIRASADAESTPSTKDALSDLEIGLGHNTAKSPDGEIQGLLIKPEIGHPKKAIAGFNAQFRKAAKALYSHRLRLLLFGQYRYLKRLSPKTLKLIPRATWHRLWRIQSSFRPLDEDRLKDMDELVMDMEIVGVDATIERAIVNLEMRADQGHEEEAIAEWEEQFANNMKGQIRQKDWLEAGTRLYAAAGDLERACQILDIEVKSHQNTDPRFILFVIWRHVETGQTSRVRKAWLLYQQLKAHPSFRLNNDDLSAIFKCFLDGGHGRAALEILKDLSTSERLLQPELRCKTVSRCSRELLSSCNKLRWIHEVALTSLSFFPKDMDLGPFFLSWLENANRFCQQPANPTETCAQIIELMFEYGCAPQPDHLNELIRVWFLMQNPEDADKAENMAWTMINKRMAIIDREKELAALSSTGSQPDSSKVEELSQIEQRLPAFLARPVPPAAARTFTHLAKHYVESDQPDYAQYVLKLLTSTNLWLNSKSHRTIITIHLTLGEPMEAWIFFNRIRAEDAGSINLHVYSKLWKGYILHMQKVRRKFEIIEAPYFRFLKRLEKKIEAAQYPSARYLFKDMYGHIVNKLLKTTEKLREKFTRRGNEEYLVPTNLYDRVVGAFMYAGDPLGALVAMRTFKEKLGCTPTRKTVKLIVHYTAKEAHRAEGKNGSEEPPKYYQTMAHSVLEYLFVNAKIHGERKPRVKDLYGESMINERGHELHDILEKYLRTLMERYWGSEGLVESYLEQARRDMGLFDTELAEPKTLQEECEVTTFREETKNGSLKEDWATTAFEAAEGRSSVW